MNILFFTYDFPFPVDSGGKNRSYHLIKYAKKNDTIHLFSFVRKEFREEYKADLQKIGVNQITVFPRKKLKELSHISSLVSFSHSLFYSLYFDPSIFEYMKSYVKENNISLIHYESYYTAFYLHSFFSELGIPQVFGTQNIEHKIYSDYVSQVVPFFARPFFYNELSKIKKEEITFLTRADKVVCVTEDEAQYIKQISGNTAVIVKNGITIENFPFAIKPHQEKKVVLFVGNFSYFPNRDAIAFFYAEVFQKLNKEYEFHIVGKGASQLSCVKDTRVRVDEYVKELSSVYHAADIFVSPVRIGGGTNFKIIEAMASGLPVIAHPHRLKALNLEEGIHARRAETAQEYISEISSVFENRDHTKEMILSARSFVEKEYQWSHIGETLHTVWKGVSL